MQAGLPSLGRCLKKDLALKDRDAVQSFHRCRVTSARVLQSREV